MSAKSRKSSKAIDRQFDSEIIRRARKISQKYQIVVELENGHYYGRGYELPNVMDDGSSGDECIAKTREALVTAVAYLLESGQKPPLPASANKRSEQINVRLTPDERVRLEEGARNHGFRGVSDFVRTSVLERLNK